MTLRQNLLALAVGESVRFDTLDRAMSASAGACKLYCGRRFTRAGLTITRIE